MNKKFKYTSLVAAGAVTLGLVGGTLAWFTAQDEVINNFNTIGNPYNPQDPDAGVDIVEDWNEEEGKDITPGTTVNKDVQVKNTEVYDQFIRVKLYASMNTSSIVEGQDGTLGSVVDRQEISLQPTDNPNVFTVVGYEEIELHFTNHLTTEPSVGDWVFNEEDGYFYYIGKVVGGNHTNTLLDEVTLTYEAGNEYRNLDFDIVVVADGIQTTNGAAVSEWNLTGDLADLYIENQKVATPVDELEPTDKNENDDHNHNVAPITNVK